MFSLSKHNPTGSKMIFTHISERRRSVVVQAVRRGRGRGRGEAARRQLVSVGRGRRVGRVGREGRVGCRRGGRGSGGRGAAQRGGDGGVDGGPRRLVGGRVGVAARVVEGRVVGAAVEVGRVGRGGAAGGRVVAGAVGGRDGRVHGAPRRLRLGLMVRGGRVRVRPARLAGREVALHE